MIGFTLKGSIQHYLVFDCKVKPLNSRMNVVSLLTSIRC